jgi:hypothetical protein
VTEWAVRWTADHVLEPSCGEAAFLLAAVDHLARLRGLDPAPETAGAPPTSPVRGGASLATRGIGSVPTWSLIRNSGHRVRDLQ